MNAQELRIGNNILNGLGEIIEVNPATIVYFNTGNHLGDGFKPIPLTEEWLIDLGFKIQYSKSFDNSMNLSFATIKTNVFITGIFELWTSNLKLPYYARSGQGGVEINYVHQLQNLFFALTGTELELQ